MDVDELVSNATASLALRSSKSRDSSPVLRTELALPIARRLVCSVHECTAANRSFRDLSARAGRSMLHRLLAGPFVASLGRLRLQTRLALLTQLLLQQKC
jgi:hypothetical protein